MLHLEMVCYKIQELIKASFHHLKLHLKLVDNLLMKANQSLIRNNPKIS